MANPQVVGQFVDQGLGSCQNVVLPLRERCSTTVVPGCNVNKFPVKNKLEFAIIQIYQIYKRKNYRKGLAYWLSPKSLLHYELTSRHPKEGHATCPPLSSSQGCYMKNLIRSFAQLVFQGRWSPGGTWCQEYREGDLPGHVKLSSWPESCDYCARLCWLTF